MTKTPLAVIGAGLIGRTHIDVALNHPSVSLAAIIDVTPESKRLASELGVPWSDDFTTLLGNRDIAGAVVATPNKMHAPIASELLRNGVPVLVEKPISDSVEGAVLIEQSSRESSTPALVGHQRRYNAIIRIAKQWIDEGRLGRIVTAVTLATQFKPEEYFDIEWRKKAGGGPVLINLIHDIDILRFLCGEIESVFAYGSNAIRNFDVEDTAAVAIRFASGAVGTVTVSDTTVAPWIWDFSSGESERFPRQKTDASFISGDQGSLTLPGLEFWSYRGTRSWHEPISMERTVPYLHDPYDEQLRHFAAVIAGQEAPICSARDGLATLQAAAAVNESVAAGLPVRLPSPVGD